MLMTTCPECGSRLDLDEEELEEGDLVTCEECGSELRVIGVAPLELEDAEDEDEEDDELDSDEEDEEESWH
jgi:alpha-aminoadipate/glutamate carrier protein LysW